MITYTKGDAVFPQGEGTKIIANICNDIGAWGAGFVLSVSQEHPLAEQKYRRWYQEQEEEGTEFYQLPMALGNTLFVQTKPDVWVANMVAQTGIMPKAGTPPIRYEALRDCLTEVAEFALASQASIHMPRIGCGLAGGVWSEVEKIIEEVLQGISVTVYDFQSDDRRTIPWKK